MTQGYIEGICEELAEHATIGTGDSLSGLALQAIGFLQEECVRLEKELRQEKFLSAERLKTINKMFSNSYVLRQEVEKYENAFYYTAEWLEGITDYPEGYVVETALTVSTVKNKNV